MSLIVSLILILLAPLPRPSVPNDVDDAVLVSQVWAMEWGACRQECHFWIEGQSNYWSPQFGGGLFAVGRGGRVEFHEGSARYIMELRRDGLDLVGEGWRVHDDGTRSCSVAVKMVPRKTPID